MWGVLHDNDRLFASKYMLYMPTEEELREEIARQKEFFRLQHVGRLEALVDLRVVLLDHFGVRAEAPKVARLITTFSRISLLSPIIRLLSSPV